MTKLPKLCLHYRWNEHKWKVWDKLTKEIRENLEHRKEVRDNQPINRIIYQDDETSE